MNPSGRYFWNGNRSRYQAHKPVLSPVDKISTYLAIIDVLQQGTYVPELMQIKLLLLSLSPISPNIVCTYFESIDERWYDARFLRINLALCRLLGFDVKPPLESLQMFGQVGQIQPAQQQAVAGPSRNYPPSQFFQQNNNSPSDYHFVSSPAKRKADLPTCIPNKRVSKQPPAQTAIPGESLNAPSTSGLVTPQYLLEANERSDNIIVDEIGLP